MKSLRDPVHIKMCKVLKEARAAARMSQTELAKKLRWKQSAVSSMESGGRRVDVGEFHRIAQALGQDSLKLYKKGLNSVRD